MQIKKDYGEEPVRRDLGLVLLLMVLGAFGLLLWTGLFLAVQWSVSNAWTAAVAPYAAASSAQTPPAPRGPPAAQP
jgi:hypothetical protein